MPDITAWNKDDLLLRYARNGCAPLVEMVLRGKPHLAHKIMTRRRVSSLLPSKGGLRWSGSCWRRVR